MKANNVFTEDPQKDYMGIISWSRCSSSAPIAMFGSEIKTNNPIHIRIDHAKVCHFSGMLDDTILSDGKPFIDIDMTPMQWAEFITSGNTSGTPCTITQVNGTRMSKVEQEQIAIKYKEATEKSFEQLKSGLKEFENVIKTALDSGKALTKTQLKELLFNMQVFRQNSISTVDFIQDSFYEDMAKVVSKAKTEVNSYAESHLTNTDIKCLLNDSAEESNGK